MRLSEIVNKANAAEVARIYNENYNADGRDDGWGNVESFEKFRSILNQTVGIRGGDRQMSIYVSYIPEKNMIPGKDGYYDVSAQYTNEDGWWSVESADWGECKEAEVKFAHCEELSVDESAAHVYFEMTYHGWPEESRQFFDDLVDQAEQLIREMDANKKD